MQTLTDLKGKKISIAVRPVDKSWIILRAWYQKQYGEDLAGITSQVYGHPL